MSARAERLKVLVERHGENVLVNGTRTVRAIVFVAGSGLRRSLFTDAELVSFNYPIWAGVVEANANVNEGDTVSRDGVNYTVRRVLTLKASGLSVLRVVLWSR